MSNRLRVYAPLLLVGVAIAFNLGARSSEAIDRLSLSDRLKNATVRIKVTHQGIGQYGSGTIVDRDGSRALIATCGHLFDFAGSQGNIRITVFDGAQERNLVGEVLAFDLKRDLALIRVAGVPDISPIPLGDNRAVQVGDPIIVAGCDYGNEVKSWHCQVSSVNRSYGPPTIGVSAMPRHGRSGGAAVSASGRLVGICNAMNPFHGEGVYAAVSSVHDLLRTIGTWTNAEAMTAQAPQEYANAPKRVGRPSETKIPSRVGSAGTPADTATRSKRSVALFVPDAKPASLRTTKRDNASRRHGASSF